MKTLVRLLTKKKLKLSVAESCTGGMLASSITSISGASKIFNLGLVTYSNQAKIRILRVNKNIINEINNALNTKIASYEEIELWDGNTSDRIFKDFNGK